MTIIHWISWISLVVLIPPVLWVLWIKNRSAITSWVRPVQHPERWLLSTKLPSSATQKDIHKALREVVTQSKNSEWNASCAYKKRDPATGEWTVGLISPSKPLETDVPSPYTFTSMAKCKVLRVSCPANEENTNIKNDLDAWAKKNHIEYLPEAISLSAQSYQCWEWNLAKPQEDTSSSWTGRLSETIFEMRDIALYPIVITIIAIFLCGTGNFWLFGIGVFTIILMSGAHKFVFMYQREDITQEEHLQNY